MQYHHPLAFVLLAGSEGGGGGGQLGFVQDMDEVPLHDPVAFQLLQPVVLSAVTPVTGSAGAAALPSAPCTDTSLKVVSLKRPQCK